MIVALVLVAWGVVVVQHVRREYFAPEVERLRAATLSLAPGTHFYALTMGGRSVGLAASALDTLPDGFRLDDHLTLELPALGQTGTAVARTRVELDRALSMRSFTFSLDSDVGRFEANGRMRSDTVLEVEVVSEGARQTIEHRLAEAPVMAAVVPIRVAMGGHLEVGERVQMPVFDATTLALRTVEVEVLGHDTLVVADSAALDPGGRWVEAGWDTVPAWKIVERFGGVSVESWVDHDGRVLRSESPLGFVMEATEYELTAQLLADARADGGRGRADDDVILATAIQSNVDLTDAESHDELRFVLSGVDLTGFDLEGGHQQLNGDTLVVRRADPSALDPGYRLPYPRMDLRAALAPEPLIQSDDPRVISLARTLAGRRATALHDARGVARELNRAVFELLEKTVTFSVPSAVQVLESRQGDCNEHTVLYVAMARALGLPARTAVGLVFVNGAFFYHAWPEVWLGEWTPVDPTFGQYPADASHIRFIVGGLAQQVELVRLIGRLEIEVVGGSRAEE